MQPTLPTHYVVCTVRIVRSSLRGRRYTSTERTAAWTVSHGTSSRCCH